MNTILYANVLILGLGLALGYLVVLSDGFVLPLILWLLLCLMGLVWHWFNPNFFNSGALALGLIGAVFGLFIIGLALSSYHFQLIQASTLSQVGPLPKSQGDIYLDLQQPPSLDLSQLIIETSPANRKRRYAIHSYYAPFQAQPNFWLKGDVITSEVWTNQEIQTKTRQAALEDAQQTRFLCRLQSHAIPNQIQSKDIQFLRAWPQGPPKGFDWLSLILPNLVMSLLYGLLYWLLTRLFG